MSWAESGTGGGLGGGVGGGVGGGLGGGLWDQAQAEVGESLELDDLLRQVLDLGGSDLHLTTGVPPTIRVRGEMRASCDYLSVCILPVCATSPLGVPGGSGRDAHAVWLIPMV